MELGTGAMMYDGILSWMYFSYSPSLLLANLRQSVTLFVQPDTPYYLLF